MKILLLSYDCTQGCAKAIKKQSLSLFINTFYYILYLNMYLKKMMCSGSIHFSFQALAEE